MMALETRAMGNWKLGGCLAIASADCQFLFKKVNPRKCVLTLMVLHDPIYLTRSSKPSRG